MKLKYLIRILIIILVVTGLCVLSVFFFLQRDATKQFISHNYFQCAQIAYTCPQYTAAFSSWDGCGCQTGFAKNKEVGRFQDLVKQYIATKIIIPQHKNGKIFSAYVLLKGIDKSFPKLDYQIYAVLTEYYVDGKKIQKGQEIFTPIDLDIEEQNTYFVIWHHILPRAGKDFDKDIQNRFDPEVSKWLSKETKENRDAVIQDMKKDVYEQALAAFVRQIQ